jgi:riboflavin kinase/FMN adenylyltransferase
MEFLFGSKTTVDAPTAVVVGKFDGLHAGHMKMIDEMKLAAKKDNLKTAVVSFLPFPAVFFGAKPEPKLLTTDEKRHVLERNGVDIYVELPFNADFANLSPEQFIKGVLADRLGCRNLLIGEDFRFGKGRAGDAKMAQTICDKHNVKLAVIPHEIRGDEKVSSHRIRELISDRKLSQARDLLGYEYFAMGMIKSQKLLPPSGAYAAEIQTTEASLMAIIKITDREIEWFPTDPNIKKEEAKRITFLSSL